jgi:hypothetical protein
MRDNPRSWIVFCAIALFIFCAPTVTYASIFGRNPVKDVEKEAGSTLSKDETEIVSFVFEFYGKKYGCYETGDSIDKAAGRMNGEQYENTVRQAAKVSKSPVAKGLLATGKTGEKVLKALIVTAEDGAKTAGQWIDKKSKEYDERKK